MITNPIQKSILNNLIGLSKDEAIAYLEKKNLNYRIIKEDNNYHVVTRDYKLDRFNLIILDNKVIEIRIG